ncbi:hypothetical protein [Chryseobacterium sp. SN22]|uniref:hypothetical protein n=1 Tax=Chryseobacterium sp. SN22 TaxID=2606431 RepID=UPI001624C992|nr:hypothetical protein [Chryseobacterium sp. SN22]
MNSTSFNTLKMQNRAGLYNQQGVPQQPMVLNRVNPAGGRSLKCLGSDKISKSLPPL